MWFPVLAPSVETMKLGQAAETPAQWAAFVEKYRREMAEPAASQRSTSWPRCRRPTDLSVGCYCEDETHCHRSVLRALAPRPRRRIA